MMPLKAPLMGNYRRSSTICRIVLSWRRSEDLRLADGVYEVHFRPWKFSWFDRLSPLVNQAV